MTHSFRIIPSHPDDLSKPYIRIPKEDMRRLGVSSGNVVCVTGTRRTAAICLPLDGTVLPYDPKFNFVYNTKSIMPLVRPSDVVLKNVGEGIMPVVELEKAKTVMLAENVTLASSRHISYKMEHLDTKGLGGTPFTKGDRVRIKNLESDTRYPFIDFTVIDASPVSYVHIISEMTKFHFVTSDSRTSHVHQPYSPKKIIQIGNKISDRKIEIILESLEMYDDGFGIFLGIEYTFDEPREWVENNVHVMASVRDDLGSLYRFTNLRRGGSHRSDGNPHHSKIGVMFAPPLNEDVGKITLEIGEISWTIRQKKDLQILEDVNDVIRSEPTVVSVWQPHKSHYMIATGPWSFVVDLK